MRSPGGGVGAWRTLLTAVAATLPLWFVDELPGRDVPQHLLMLELGRRSWDAGSGLLSLWKLVPGSLFYWFGLVLPPQLDPHWVARIAVAAAIIGLVVGVRGLTQAVHGRSGTAVAYAVLLTYGWHFYEGNLSLLLGIPVFLAGMVLLLGLVESQRPPPIPRTAVSVLAVGALLYLSNLSLFVLFLAALALGEWLPTRRRLSGSGIAGVLLSGLLVHFAMVSGQQTYGSSLDCDFVLSDGFCQPLRWRWPNFDRNLQFAYESLAIWKIPAGVVLLGVPAAIYGTFLARRASSSLQGDQTVTVSNARVLMLVGVLGMAVVLFGVFPDLIPVAGYVRLNTPFGTVAAILALALRPGIAAARTERVLAWGILPLAFLGAVTWVHLQVRAAREPSQQVMAAVPPGSTVLVLDFRPNRTAVFQNPQRFDFCEYHLAHGGRSPYTFAWYLASPVRYERWLLRYPPLASPERFRCLTHSFGYGAIVTLGSPAEHPRVVTDDLERGAWRAIRFHEGVVWLSPPGPG